MSGSSRDPHFFDCPSCQALATLRLLERKGRRKREYVCSECQARFDEEAVEQASEKREAHD
jgi:transcription elongation factor Elf1